MAEMEGKARSAESDTSLSDDQLQDVAGGLRDPLKEEFSKSDGGKARSERIKEDFEEGLGNTADVAEG